MATATVAPTKTTVLYDGLCKLCQRSVAILKRLDWLGRLHFADCRDPANVPPGFGLELSRMLEEMHTVTPAGRVTHGFGAFRTIAWRLPLLAPFAPLLYIPGVPWVGQRVYLWVAKNRYNLVPCHDGQCQVTFGKKN
ncbi:MAG: DUF393 domain-containing protein [Gemmataceae bacterium]